MDFERAASALQWWIDAGADTIVGEAPRDWLAAPAAAAAPQPAPAPLMPDTLDALQAWLRDSPDLPFASPGAPRLGPAGDPQSGLMVVVDMPSIADAAAGQLLSGEAGELFDRMLNAIHRSRDTIYLAPLSPVRSPSGAIDARAAAALADIARHHVALAAPRQLLLFGDVCAKALLGTPVSGARGRWLELATATGLIKTLVTIRPEKLLLQPGLKRLAWEDLQMLLEPTP